MGILQDREQFLGKETPSAELAEAQGLVWRWGYWRDSRIYI